LTRNLAANCLLESDDGHTLTLRLAPSQAAMQAEVHQTRIEKALAGLGVTRRVVFFVEALPEGLETPRQREVRHQTERHAQAVDVLQRDPHIVELKQAFGAQLVETSVKPVDAAR